MKKVVNNISIEAARLEIVNQLLMTIKNGTNEQRISALAALSGLANLGYVSKLTLKHILPATQENPPTDIGVLILLDNADFENPKIYLIPSDRMNFDSSRIRLEQGLINIASIYLLREENIIPTTEWIANILEAYILEIDEQGMWLEYNQDSLILVLDQLRTSGIFVSENGILSETGDIKLAIRQTKNELDRIINGREDKRDLVTQYINSITHFVSQTTPDTDYEESGMRKSFFGWRKNG